MDFVFAKYVDVTDLAFKVNPEYEANQYKKVYLCPDVHCVWIARILEGFNKDYEPEEGSVLVEIEQSEHEYKGQGLNKSRAEQILRDDELENWDCHEFCSMDEAIEEVIDGGYGVGQCD